MKKTYQEKLVFIEKHSRRNLRALVVTTIDVVYDATIKAKAEQPANSKGTKVRKKG